MKKLLLVLAIGTFVACNDSGSTDAPATDTTTTAAPPVDSTATAPVDSTATADTTKPADSTIKK